MNTLIDRIGDRENHPLIGLLDIVTIFVRDYEAHNIKLPDAAPASVLRLLMEQHDMRQTDLAKIDYDPDSRFNAFDLVGIKQYLEHELGVAVDVTTRDGLHPMLRADIEQSALRVF